jgi:hypothetical protein
MARWGQEGITMDFLNTISNASRKVTKRSGGKQTSMFRGLALLCSQGKVIDTVTTPELILAANIGILLREGIEPNKTYEIGENNGFVTYQNASNFLSNLRNTNPETGMKKVKDRTTQEYSYQDGLTVPDDWDDWVEQGSRDVAKVSEFADFVPTWDGKDKNLDSITFIVSE